jgi:hypothetical protein
MRIDDVLNLALHNNMCDLTDDNNLLSLCTSCEYRVSTDTYNNILENREVIFNSYLNSHVIETKASNRYLTTSNDRNWAYEWYNLLVSTVEPTIEVVYISEDNTILPYKTKIVAL